MTRYLKDGTATGVSVHSVRSLGTVEGLETFEVYSHGGPYDFPTVTTYTPNNPHARELGIKLPVWEVKASMGWLHVTGPARETPQAFDGIARRVRPGYRFIGQERAYGSPAQGEAGLWERRVTRAYSLYTDRVCGGETGNHDDRCGRRYGHAGPCDWTD